MPAALTFAVRGLARTPAAALLAVATMIVAIGAATAVFSIVHGTVLRPLPYPRPDALAVITSEFPSIRLRGMGLSSPELFELQAMTGAWTHLGAVSFGTATLGGPEPRRTAVAAATASLFGALGVAPAVGRVFSSTEDRPGAPPVALLAHGLWLREYGGDPAVLDRTIELDGERRAVVGVMPQGFDLLGTDTEVWVPLALDPGSPGARADHNLRVVGRLRDGVTMGEARADLDAAVSRWMTTTGELHSPAPRFHPLSLAPLHEVLVGDDVRRSLVVLLAAVGFLLALACANISNLLLARAEGARHQLAVRIALGASRRHLLRDHLVEGLAIAAAGGTGGVLVAWLAVRALVAGSVPLARRNEIGLDPVVLAFGAAVTIACGLVFGLVPALRTDVARAQRWLRGDGRGLTAPRERRRLQQALIAGQVALALTLLSCAGVLLRSFWKLAHVDPGVRPESVLTFQVSLPERTFAADEQVWSYFERLVETLASLPGVSRAGVMSGGLPQRRANNTTFILEGVPVRGHEGMPQVEYLQHVTPDSFAALGVRLLRGRVFTPEDSERAQPVAVVNETLARKFFPGSDPIGRRLRALFPDNPWVTVVGVVSDVRHAGLASPIGAELYVAHRQSRLVIPGWLPSTMHVVIKTDPARADAVRRAVPDVARAVDRRAAVANLRAMSDAMSVSIAGPRFLASAVAAFAAMALLLASVGIYGVIACIVSQRTAEYGVRLALGAPPRAVFALVMAQAALPVGAGSAAGLAGALAAGRLLTTQLFQTRPADPATLGTIVVVLGIVAFVACAMPARRATRVDPLDALRNV